jgi:hypothetical protein
MADEPRQLSVVEHEAYEVFELADEEQIIAEISGRVTDKFVYELKGVRDEKGQPVVGLSYSGTNWACREYAKRGECIRVVGQPQLMVCPVDAEYIIAVVTVQRVAVDKETGREVVLDSTFGIKRQWRKMKKWKRDEHGNIVGEEIIADTFYWEKAVSKAIRNGKQGLIPTDVVKQLIGEALKMKSAVRETRGPGRPPGKTASAPPQPPQPQQTQPAKPPAPASPTNPPLAPPAAAAPATPVTPPASPPAAAAPPTPTAQPPAPPGAPPCDGRGRRPQPWRSPPRSPTKRLSKGSRSSSGRRSTPRTTTWRAA